MSVIENSLAAGLKAFTTYNRNKKRVMQMNDPIGARVILNLVPLSIHINHPELPGYLPDEDCPQGIKSMELSLNSFKSLTSFFPVRIKPGDLQNLEPEQRYIEGLFTIGSVGSVGQTRESDYDIWVVVDSKSVGRTRMRLLERKLKNLQRWITSQYIIEIHFFLMDVIDIQQNNFGMVSQEGSGSALKNILKEEFYRTMTLIEGRVPLWWVVPPRGDDEDAYPVVQRMLGTDSKDYIDMGNITSIPEDELLGAALWQMHKALDDPLKSVLKMALVATYLDSSSGTKLLCEEIKKHLLYAGEGEIIDPYVEVFQRVEDYYRSKGDEKTIDLLRKCFYLKVSPNINLYDLLKIDYYGKTSIMVQVLKKWNWSIGFFRELNSFQDWNVDKYREFGDELHDYLKRTTVLLIRRAKSFIANSQPDQDVEMEILRRRIEAFYVSKENKIDPEKRVKKKEPAYEEIFFSYKKKKWLIHAAYPERGKEKPIMTSDRVVKILAWLAYNKRIDASTAFHMIPNSSRAALSDIQMLLRELNLLIPDVNSIGLDRSSLMEKKYVKEIVIIGNMEVPDLYDSIQEVDILYTNSWDELFCIHVPPASLRSWMKKNRTPKTKISIWLPRDGKSKYLVNMLYSLSY